jgi:RNA polymerase sigma factor (sigma-70 family)
MTLLHEHIVTAAGDGDRAAQERLLTLHAPITRCVVRRTLSRRFPMWEEGDATQAAELAVIESAATCRDTAGFAGYAASAALRDCLRERRLYHPGFVVPNRPAGEFASMSGTEPEEGDAIAPSPEVELFRSAEAARIRERVDRLPEPLRVTLIRRFGMDGSTPETQGQVARALGVARKTVNEREARALRILREKGGLN